MTRVLAAAGASWSNALLMGEEIAMSGVLARGPDGAALAPGDAGAQAWAIFDLAAQRLAELGASLAHVYKLVIYLTDIADRPAVNRVRAERLRAPYPCSTLVGVQALAGEGFRVEIDFAANLGFVRHD